MTTSPQECLLLIRKVLGDNYCTVKVKGIVVTENLEHENTSIELSLQHGPLIESTGVGMVDAIFTGLQKHYASNFSSLSGLELTRFYVRAKSRSTKAEVEVDLEIRNSYGRLFLFSDSSKSLIASTARVSVGVLEFFANSELAFFSVLNAYKDAKLRGREDLVTRYLSELAILVDNTSYSEVLDKARSELLDEVGRSKK